MFIFFWLWTQFELDLDLVKGDVTGIGLHPSYSYTIQIIALLSVDQINLNGCFCNTLFLNYSSVVFELFVKIEMVLFSIIFSPLNPNQGLSWWWCAHSIPPTGRASRASLRCAPQTPKYNIVSVTRSITLILLVLLGVIYKPRGQFFGFLPFVVTFH